MKIQILVILTFLASDVYAQESSSETQSIRCSALMHVLTNITTPPNFNGAMAQANEFYSGVFATFREARTGSRATNGEVSNRRDTIEAELREAWQAKPAAVVQELALCNTWRAEYAPRLAAQGGEIRSGKQLMEIVGSPPAKPRDGEADKWVPIANIAFTAWSAAGSKAGGETKAELRRQLAEPLRK